ncbi:hypothetical protein GCWU000341_01900 [Oribacterium sp. oral taxon 078 str. F0262]|nr:hypothetical protein GCWU000341_01900 [Oribacterium sp. oral taxon 078 str. F0262]
MHRASSGSACPRASCFLSFSESILRERIEWLFRDIWAKIVKKTIF